VYPCLYICLNCSVLCYWFSVVKELFFRKIWTFSHDFKIYITKMAAAGFSLRSIVLCL